MSFHHKETSGGVLTIERFRVTFTANSKHKFVSHDLLYMLSVHYFYPTISSFMLVLFMIIMFGLFCEILNLNLMFAVCHKHHSNLSK